MAYLTWLADILRKEGLQVQEEGGWQQRGHGDMADIRGVLLHHTAGAPEGNYPSLAIVRDGDASLPGPRANLGLARDGSWIVIAAGQAWHAGKGGPWQNVPKDDANQYMIGVEAESVGTRFDWTPAQIDSYPRGVAALLRHVGLGADRALAHKEWAPERKTDPAFWPGDMAGFRASVAEVLGGAPAPGPTPPPPAPAQAQPTAAPTVPPKPAVTATAAPRNQPATPTPKPQGQNKASSANGIAPTPTPGH
jgi:hypothetical protein